MFKQLNRLLDDCTEVTIKVTRGPEGKLKVYVMPSAKNAIEKATAQPQVLCATPEELETGFAGALDSFITSRSTLVQQVQATQAAHAKAAAGQKAAATKPAQAPTSRKPVVSNEDEDDELQPISQDVSEDKASAVSTGTDMLSLLSEED